MFHVKKRNFKDTTKYLFLRYTVIPILLIIILFFVFTLVLLNIKTIYDTKKSGKIIENEISNVYTSYTNEIERMTNSPIVHDVIKKNGKNHLVYEEFYNFNTVQDIKSGFHLINNQNVFMASTIPSNSRIDSYIFSEVIPQVNKESDELFTDVKRISIGNGKSIVFTMGKAVKSNEKVVGYIIYQLYEEDLQRMIFGESADIVVVTDYYDYILASTNQIITGLMNKFTPTMLSKSQVKIKDDKYYMHSIQTSDHLFTIYTLKSVKNDTIIYWYYSIFTILISILLFFLLNKLAEKMSTKNVESIEKLMEAVTKLEKGDMKAYVEIKTGDEFEVLANQFNSMLDSLNELIIKNEELSNIRRVKEIRLLESQFNPHFLFNVLETLRYMLFIDANKAQEIIFSLSRLLRYSLSGATHEVSFEKDLNYIIDYLKLHKFRFGERLDYQIEIQEEVKSALVPRLLLQPLIENAIKYGYYHQPHLFITISGKVENGIIIFKVIDNGKGIDKEKLNSIKKELFKKEISDDTGIGLYNTHRRIILQYGEEYGLSIESKSTKSTGTKVEIRIPYAKGAREDV